MIPQGVQVFVALEPVDMRYSFDRLSGLAQEQVGYDARGGALFVFFGRRRDALKILFFDGSGMCQSVLQKARSRHLRRAHGPRGRAPRRSRRRDARRAARRRAGGVERSDAHASPSHALRSCEKTSRRGSTRIAHVVTSTAVLGSVPLDPQQLAARVAQLEVALATAHKTLSEVTAERDKLRRAYEQLKEQLELLRRRIYVAKAERIDTAQLEIEFAETKAKLDALARQIDDATTATTETNAAGDPPAPPPAATRPKPTGRRNLGAHDLPEERVEIFDPAFAGQEPIGFEESFKLKYRRGGPVRLVVARAIYKPQATPEPETQAAQPVLVTTSMPLELFPRGLLAPSMIAHLVVQKYRWGLPFHRQARMLAADGFGLDDGTMCRYAEDAGATLGCIVEAMAKEARSTAFCLSTDATGVCIQPEPLAGGRRAHLARRRIPRDPAARAWRVFHLRRRLARRWSVGQLPGERPLVRSPRRAPRPAGALPLASRRPFRPLDRRRLWLRMARHRHRVDPVGS